MDSLTKQQIKEIAEELDCGFRCFWNIKNNEIAVIPDELSYPDIDIELWKEQYQKIDDNFNDFKEIEKPSSKDSFNIMLGFVDSLPDSLNIKQKLSHSLGGRRPFREFKYLIDNSGQYRQMWFDFKSTMLQQWVEDKINEIRQTG